MYIKRIQSNVPKENGQNRRLNWILFCLIFVAFIFAQIHYLFYSRDYAISCQTAIYDVVTMLNSIQHGNISRQIGVLLLGIFGAFSVIRNRSNKLRMKGFLGAIILIFFFWIFLSIFWADDPILAGRRSISFALLWLAALGFASRFTERETLLFLFFASLTFVLLGLSIEVILGTFHPVNLGYRFCGTLHPNHQAWNCAGIVFTGVVLLGTEQRYRSLFFNATLLGLVALILTKSRTATAACILALLIYAVLMSRPRQRFFYILGAAFFLCTLLFIFGQERLSSSASKAILLGRNDGYTHTLTGRTLIWSAGLNYFYQRPLHGYGFRAFETVQHISELEKEAGWAASAMHSEYLSLFLGVGIVGTILYILIIANGLLRTMHLHKKTHSKYYAIECAILVFYISSMLLENLGRIPNVITFISFVILLRRGFVMEHILEEHYLIHKI